MLDGVAVGDGGLFVGLGLVPVSAEGLVVGVKAGFPPQPAMTTAKTAKATRRLTGVPTGRDMNS